MKLNQIKFKKKLNDDIDAQTRELQKQADELHYAIECLKEAKETLKNQHVDDESICFQFMANGIAGMIISISTDELQLLEQINKLNELR